MVDMDDDTESDGSLSAVHRTGSSDVSCVSASVTDLHALAAFGEIDSLEQALRSRAGATDTSLVVVVNQPDELGLTLLHAAAQSGQPHVSDRHQRAIGAQSSIDRLLTCHEFHLHPV